MIKRELNVNQKPSKIPERKMRYKSTVFILLLVGIMFLFAVTSIGAVSGFQVIQFTQKSNNSLSLSADLEGITRHALQIINNSDEEILSCGTGITYNYNKPILPFISKVIIIPPQAAVKLNVEVGDIRVVPLDSSPRICLDEEVRCVDHIDDDYEIYPPQLAEISTPYVIRGVRMVKLTLNPVRYQKSTNCLIFCDNLQAELEFTDDEPINPVEHPNRSHRSSEFMKFLDQYAENSEIIRRDHVDEIEYKGDHYLVVTHEGCLPYVAPLIEWKRKSGHKVDILSIPNNISRDPEQIKPLIQERYDAYLEDGVDPFDQLLLIGDRSGYVWTGPGPWQLEAERGESIWGGGASHADYKYALLEGDDNYPDVGFARFCAGSQETMELFVRRTIAYEAEPYMDETEWFTRGGVYSQHWGNMENHSWRVTIPANVRWARELLRVKGFDDIRFYEDYEWDQIGLRVGHWVRDLINERTNLLLGRAENCYWNQAEFVGVEENVVFPVRLVLSDYGNYATWTMIRSGDGNNLKGPVASTCNWGESPTISTTASWIEMVNTIVQQGMSYGWGRTATIAQVENYFPNFEFGQGWRAYTHIRTDMEFYGDPGLRVWMGVPTQLNIEFPEVIDENANVIEVFITDEDSGLPIEGAFVSVYDPVGIPDFGEAEYADYSDMKFRMSQTTSDGSVQFIQDDDFEFRPESTIQLTVFGKQICPFHGEIEVGNPEFTAEVTASEISEVQGNGDEYINPGESYDVSFTFVNNGEEDIEGLMLGLSSASPHFEIVTEDTIEIGALAAGAEIELQNPIRVQVYWGAPDGDIHNEGKPVLVAKLYNENGSSITGVQFDVVTSHLYMNDIVGGADIPYNDDVYRVDIQVTNDGRLDSPSTNAVLVALDSWVNVTNPNSEYPGIAVGEGSELEGETFAIEIGELTYPGVATDLVMVLSRGEVFLDSIFFSLNIGEEVEDSPQKPDKYGYICLDDTDTNWVIAPEFNWIEISLQVDDRDFDGILLEELTGDSPFDVGEVTAIPLPFQFRFYGQTYDTISVTTNGFICPGNQNVTNPQNWPLDRSMGGGAGMIAPFWDWLMMDNQSRVYYYHNSDEHYIVVEWYRFKQYPEGETDLTFQVIIYHPQAYLNESGDSNILMQYSSIENGEGFFIIEDNIAFASVGISSPDGLSGINYTFGGEYPVTSAPLDNQRAIKFTTSMWEEFQEPPRLGAIYGMARDAGTNAPIGGVTIELSSGQDIQTGGDGFFCFTQFPADDIFDITASHELFRDTTYSDLQIGDTDSLEVNFALQEILRINPEDDPASYKGFELIAIYPQPFNSTATVKFFIEEAGEVNFSIFDLSGRQVENFAKNYSAKGIKTMKIESSEFVAGLYFLQINSKYGSISRKIVFVK
jgi:hypothetical protein